MSIARASYVKCDSCGNPAPVACLDGAREARQLAHEQGFVRVSRDSGLRHEDLCAACIAREGDTA